MDPSGVVRHPVSGQRRRGGLRGQKISNHGNPQLFDDTSTQPPMGYTPAPGPVPVGQDVETPSYPQYAPQVPVGQDVETPSYPQYAPQVPVGQDVQTPSYPQYAPQGQSYPQQPMYDSSQTSFGYAGQQYMADPMANVAMQYGQTLAGQGKDYVHKNLEKYVSTSKLKYYFAVDTAYVGKKIGLLIFPFVHSDWSIKYNQDEPVAPRYELNAPDLYIPVMAYVTYILLAGLMLGTQDKFSPEQLGMTASTALVWMIIEILLLLLAMYIMQVTTDLKYLDLLSYCGYKYIGMILSMIAGLLFHSLGYYVTLIYVSITLAFFLIRALKFAIIPHTDQEGFARGNKRRLYTLFVIALSQPILMWWLTQHLVPS